MLQLGMMLSSVRRSRESACEQMLESRLCSRCCLSATLRRVLALACQ